MDASSSQFLGDSAIERRLSKIPIDQQKLLDRPDSWAHLLSRRPKGFVNLPPEILENLREWSSLRSRPTPSHTQHGSNDEQPADSDPPGPPTHLPSRPDQTAGEEVHDEGEDDDMISWASSPERNLRPPAPSPRSRGLGRQNASPALDGDELEGSKTEAVGVQPFMTQAPEHSPVQPTVLSSAKRSSLTSFPPSSLGQDEELEVHVPIALEKSTVSVNKDANPVLNTPPSAQVVPCTFDQSSHESALTSEQQQAHTDHVSKRRIYKKAVLYRPPRANLIPMDVTAIDEDSRGKHLDLANSHTLGSLPTSCPSSSIIPSTHQEVSDKDTPVPQQISAPSPGLDDIPPSPQPSQNHGRKRPERPAVGSNSPGSVSTLPRDDSSSTVPLGYGRTQSDLDKVKKPPAPFSQYSIMYPSYKGTINDFITSCMYIQLKQRRLRTSLYDDFIRAWYEGYIPYVGDCDKQRLGPLNAIEWYNQIDDDPIFTARVVTRQNLDSTLNEYPEELRAARRLLGVSNRPEPYPAQPPAQTEVVSKLPAGTNVHQMEATSLAESHCTTRQDTLSTITPTPALAPIPQRQQRGRIQTTYSRSFDGIEPRPVRSRGLERSLSEANSHKRKASRDSNNAVSMSKRTPIISKIAPNPFSADDTSPDHHRRTSKGVTVLEYTGDQGEERDQGIKKLDSRKNPRVSLNRSGQGTFPSWAPLRNTPTSGQKY
ncbi:hypothetical protein F5Y15DRAFT_386735 [Xylariaceae sp. FL0016]|nr:hypothetical protein F5Y15DRAFT_386735 [Xylariaceae sp. FL0016]